MSISNCVLLKDTVLTLSSAFKFLPVLGRYVADSFEGKATDYQKNKWAWKQLSLPISRGDGSRGGPPRRSLRREEQARL